jgi:hypothetical protein
MEMMVWNIILTAIVGVMVFLIKSKFEELDRMGVLLNRTREEIARDHITRAEVRADMDKIMDRFEDGITRLEAKIDKLAEKGN